MILQPEKIVFLLTLALMLYTSIVVESLLLVHDESKTTRTKTNVFVFSARKRTLKKKYYKIREDSCAESDKSRRGRKNDTCVSSSVR